MKNHFDLGDLKNCPRASHITLRTTALGHCCDFGLPFNSAVFLTYMTINFVLCYNYLYMSL